MNPRAMRVVSALAAALGLQGAGCHASMAGPPVCDATSGCTTGQSCVLGRCRLDGTLPVSSLAQRIPIAPIRVARLDARSPKPRGPSVQSSLASPTLVVAFPPIDVALHSLPGMAEERARAVQRATLVIEGSAVRDDAPCSLSLELAEVVEPWSASGPTTHLPPRTDLPRHVGTLPFARRQPLVVDVTEIVREWLMGRQRHGLMLRGTSESDARCAFDSGGHEPGSPRLEVFIAPSRPDRLDDGPPESPASDATRVPGGTAGGTLKDDDPPEGD